MKASGESGSASRYFVHWTSLSARDRSRMPRRWRSPTWFRDSGVPGGRWRQPPAHHPGRVAGPGGATGRGCCSPWPRIPRRRRRPARVPRQRRRVVDAGLRGRFRDVRVPGPGWCGCSRRWSLANVTLFRHGVTRANCHHFRHWRKPGVSRLVATSTNVKQPGVSEARPAPGSRDGTSSIPPPESSDPGRSCGPSGARRGNRADLPAAVPKTGAQCP